MYDSDQNAVPQKAAADDFLGRYREIVSDPLNLLIPRHPFAGTVDGDNVVLHNGNRVAYRGPLAYYEGFSSILVINRGVHEPLEEYAFHAVLKRLEQAPTMIELGAYWGHYSMWLKRARPDASIHLIEPSEHNLNVGKLNCELNGIEARFSQLGVARGGFGLDAYFASEGIDHLTIVHSDIQGAEVKLLKDAKRTLSKKRVSYFFVSTHSQEIHAQVRQKLSQAKYRVEVSADFDQETTSFDGFILATHPDLPAVFGGSKPLGRTEILRANPAELLESVASNLKETQT
ncbi:MAG: FkbM family methyltransferase [Pseudomonadota bacterium]